MTASDSTSPRRLLEESAWLRELAGRLVRDPARVDDAVQETLVAAALRPPGRGFPARAWLGAVLRNALRQEHRGSERRREREARAGAPADEESTLAVVARLDVQRQVLEAVRSLAEPYRTTIALRFLDGLPPRAVARRMGVPVKTVHTRVERGLARLRCRLDAVHDGRRGAWAAALLPLATRRAPLAPLGSAGLGVLLMSSTWKWTGAALALAVVGWLAQRGLAPPPAAPPEAPGEGSVAAGVPLDLEARGEPGGGRAPSAARGGRAAVPAVEPEPEPAPAAPAPETLAGRVVDLEGEPVAGLRVEFVPTSRPEAAGEVVPPVESDGRGRFAMALPGERGRLIAAGRGYASVTSPGLAGVAPPEDPVVVVGPERSYAGQVVDGEGRPLAGVELRVLLSDEYAARLRPGQPVDVEILP